MSPWWTAMQNFVARQRQLGNITPKQASIMIKNFLLSGSESHRGSILSSAWHSTRIAQGYDITTMVPSSPLGRVECKQYMMHARRRVPASIRHDPGLSSSFIFFTVFEDYNRDAVLNSGNLEIVVEMMVSALGWLMGTNNTTHKYFFQGLQVIGGCGHYRVTTKEGTLLDNRKPNSVGSDFAAGKANDIFIMLCNKLGIPDDKNKQTFVNASRWTPTALENQGSVEVVHDSVVGLPNEDINKRPIIATECRGTELTTVIRNVYPRNDKQTGVVLVTVDPKLTNIRPTSIKYQRFRPQFCHMCTNVPASDAAIAEQWKTILAVIAAVCPGAPPYVPLQAKEGGFVNVICDKNQSRDRVLEAEPRKSILTLLLGYSHVVAAVLVALQNHAGVVPFEIPESVLGFLDWGFLYIRNHLACVLDPDVVDSFNRCREGYEARHVAYCLYKIAMELIGSDKPAQSVSSDAVIRMAQCAMLPSEVCAP